jgi:hypothetical protein
MNPQATKVTVFNIAVLTAMLQSGADILRQNFKSREELQQFISDLRESIDEQTNITIKSLYAPIV